MSVTATLPQRNMRRATGARATRSAVSAFGVLAALAGIEHGTGEILQGPVAPPSPVFESWPDAAAFAVLSGEPAMTLIPNLAVAGAVTILVAVLLAVWAVWFVSLPRGGGVLIGLSLLLLLVGGGFGPPLIGLLVGIATLRAERGQSQRPGRMAAWLAPAWRWLVAVAVVGYLSLVPGVVVASAVFGFDNPAVVAGLGLGSFAALVLSLVAARAHDRLEATRGTT